MIGAYLLPGIEMKNLSQTLLTSLVLGLANAFVKPLLVLIAFPINFLTFGLFIFIIDAAILILVAQLVPGLRIRSFGWAIMFGLVITLMNWILSGVFNL